jgi:hypothetical protein
MNVIPTGAVRESLNRWPWRSTFKSRKTWFAASSRATTGLQKGAPTQIQPKQFKEMEENALKES